ncbi:pyruvate carboxylase subunit B [Desulfonispora thiosulfatigenes DSM 11270]|uniref:Pyruvate carboxylase subunit B n=1 Tax=Desulfonispora thiosulfatigenes DSM 11270 TaxID=656914 RepID=A0A1W1UUB4_DESTI|nr:sodium-extruding oxaloacetate decarboxylase subunit alpha [Desulfonispora thiosulfatigenes]SMB84626.1 pyruvate carboxylase subunit B [Desulfonispora thiosulfatigenes DSM 11270]
MKQTKRLIGITDTTLRDSHQSLLATRMKTEDMLPIAEKMDNIGFHSLEVWGGATFDSCMRFLNEDPWERLKVLREAFKKTKLQMLLRGQNLLGYKHYADDVVDEFVKKTCEYGMDIFRVFDALNDIRNMQRAMAAVKKNGKHVQGTISYTTGTIYDIDYYVKFGKELKDSGADSICIKDMAGLLSPTGAFDLVKALKNELKLPIQMHTHYTSGMGSMMYLKAIEAGADVIDTANSALALGTSQPATETMVAVLNEGAYTTGINLEDLVPLSEYFKRIRQNYAEFDVYKSGVDVNILRYQVPGGMLSNFITQLTEQNALDKLDDCLAEVPRVREDFGYPPLVTPSSQIVGSQAALNVLLGERYKMCTNEVKNYMRGLYGRPPGKVNEDIRKKIIGDEQPITVRPADLIEPELEKSKLLYPEADTTEKLLMYILFPQVAKDFFAKDNLKASPEIKNNNTNDLKEKAKIENSPKILDCSSNTSSFAGQSFAKRLKTKNNINLNTSTNSTLNNGEIHKLSVKFEGKTYELEVEKIETIISPKETFNKAEDNKEIQEDRKVESNHKIPLTRKGVGDNIVNSPMPGKILKILKSQGEKVQQGEKVLILEAMKMENEILAPCDGVIENINVVEGVAVNSGEELFSIV